MLRDISLDLIISSRAFRRCKINLARFQLNLDTLLTKHIRLIIPTQQIQNRQIMKQNRNIIKGHIKILGIRASLFKRELCPGEILFLCEECPHTVVNVEAENSLTIAVGIIVKN